jgi:hypothetical protein
MTFPISSFVGGHCPDIDVAGTFRELVESVVLSQRQAGEEYEVKIRGHLSSLLGADMSAMVMVEGRALKNKPSLFFRNLTGLILARGVSLGVTKWTDLKSKPSVAGLLRF